MGVSCGTCDRRNLIDCDPDEVCQDNAMRHIRYRAGGMNSVLDHRNGDRVIARASSPADVANIVTALNYHERAVLACLK